MFITVVIKTVRISLGLAVFQNGLDDMVREGVAAPGLSEQWEVRLQR